MIKLFKWVPTQETAFMLAWCFAGLATYFEHAPLEARWLIPLAAAFFLSGQRLCFVLFILVQTYGIIEALPGVANHSLIILALNVLLLGHWCVVLGVKRKNLLQGDLIPPFGGFLRWLLFVVYALAFFHKLNHDFLNLNLSCATFQYQKILPTPLGAWLPETGGVYQANIYLVLGFEFLIAVLFLVHPLLAIVSGLVLHSGLSLAIFYDFASVAFALYLLLLPPLVFQQSATQLRRWGLLLFGWLVMTGLFFGVWAREVGPRFFWFQNISAILFIVIYGLFFYRLLKISSWKPSVPERMALLPIVILIAVIFNGLTPYLGLKTVANFSMFSNLRVEDGKTNHLFMKAQWQPFDHLRDSVYLLETHAPMEEWTARRGLAIPFMELRRKVTLWRAMGFKGIRLKYSRQNRIYETQDASSDEALIPSLNFFSQKFYAFRPFSPTAPMACQW